MRSVLAAGFVLLALAFAGIAAQAQTASPPALEISGAGRTVTLTPADLAKLPQVEQTVSFQSSKGVSTARYKGPLLWEVLQASRMLDGLERNKELAKTLMVTASDDYQIAFSVGELAPEFGNATILLALETDGKPLADGLRIVAQGDKRGARAIHHIVGIELR